jgi:hypothetical protein
MDSVRTTSVYIIFCLSVCIFKVKVKVTLQLTVGQSVCQGIEPIL